MPEVGVLNLTIHDDSKQAADGLNSLAGALIKCQQALGDGLKLSGVSRPLNTFAKAVQDSSKTLSNIGTFLNAVSSYTKAFKDADKVTFNAQPIKDLKDAIGDGIKIGQAGTQINKIREALGGKWDVENAVSARDAMIAIAEGSKAVAASNMGTSAKNVSKLASALNEYADASLNLKSALGDGRAYAGLENMTGDRPLGTGRLKPNLQLHGGSNKEYEQLSMDIDKLVNESIPGMEKVETQISTVTDGFKDFQVAVNQTKEGTQNFNAAVSETSAIVKDSGIDKYLANPLTSMLDKFTLTEGAMGAFGQAVEAVTPKLGEVSAESIVMTKNIEMMMSELNKPIAWNKKGFSEVVDQLTGVKHSFLDASESAKVFANAPVETLNIQLQETGDTIQSHVIPNLLDMYQILSKMAHELGWFNKEGMRLPAGEQMLALPAGEPITVDYHISEAQEATEEINNATDAAIEFARQWNYAANQKSSVADSAKDAIQWVNNLISKGSDVDLMNMKIDALTAKLYEGVSSGKMTGDQIASLVSQIQKLNEEIFEAQNATSGLTGAWNGLKGGMQKLFPTITGMIGRLGQIAKYRMLRAVIKHISSGFSEGIQNVYQYSKAVGTSFAPAMDSAATAIQQMKNSLGTALAPAIQALIPILNTVVNWFITLINYANQFFALLSGQKTWTKALPETTEAFEKQKKAAGGAGKAMKDLLADWDELNIIQSQGGGGGGGGSGKTTEEYENMFEEVSEFSEKVKEVINFINDHLGGIPGILEKAGAILLGWKFSKAFQGILGKLGKILAGLAAIQIGFELTHGAGFEAGKKGFFDTGDILATIGGTIASGLGGWLIGTAVAGPAGGAAGLAIGIGIGIIGTISGWIEGQKRAADEAKWGNLHKTQEEIEAFVKSQFSFDIVGEINVMDELITLNTTAKERVNAEVTKFNTSLDKAIIKVDADVENSEKVKAVLEAAKDAQNAVLEVNNLIDTRLKTVDFTLTHFTFHDDEGNEINSELMKTAKKASEDVEAYFNGIGEELAKYIKIGEKRELTKGEEEAAIALMQRQRNILNRAQELNSKYNQEVDLKSGMSKVKNFEDLDTATAEIEREKQLIQDWTADAEEMVRLSVLGMTETASYLEAAAEDAKKQGDNATYETLHSEAQDLLNKVTNLMDPEKFQSAVDDKLAESKKIMRNYWLEIIKEAEGDNISRIINSNTEDQVHSGKLWKWLADLVGIEYNSENKNEMQKMLKEKGIDKVADYLKENIIAGITSNYNDPTGSIKFYLEELNGDLFSLMTEEAKKQLMQNLVETTGDEKVAGEIFEKMFGLTFRDLAPYIVTPKVEVEPEVEVAKDTVEKAEEEYKNPWSWLVDPLGLAYTPPEVDTTDYSEGMENMVQETKDSVSDITELYSELRDVITGSDLAPDVKNSALKKAIELYTDGKLEELQSLIDYINQFGIEDGFKTFEEYGNGFGGIRNPKNARAAAMKVVSDVGWTPRTEPVATTPVETIKTEPKDNQQDTANVANGVKSGNQDVVSELRSVVSQLQKLLAKEWTVNVSPNSDWGNHNAKSAEASETVWGN